MLGRKPFAARIRASVTMAAAMAGVAASIGIAAAIGVATAAMPARATAVVAPPPATRADEADWAPVPYRNAQLSVPGEWLVETPQQPWCGFPQTGGMIFVGVRPHNLGQGCHLTANLAWIVPAGHIPRGIRHRKPTAVINGIPVYQRRGAQGSVVYLVPELAVRVGARGPRAHRVLATLRRSALSVVLSGAAARPVPASWTWRQYGGARFATPPSWPLQREDQWATCGTGLEDRTLLLIHATRPPALLPCPFPIPTAAAQQGEPGLTVVTGKYAARSVGQRYRRCTVRDGTRICLSTVTGQGGFDSGVLIFSVAKPHQHARAFLLLGLSGSGARARAVFDSISVAARKKG